MRSSGSARGTRTHQAALQLMPGKPRTRSSHGSNQQEATRAGQNKSSGANGDSEAAADDALEAEEAEAAAAKAAGRVMVGLVGHPNAGKSLHGKLPPGPQSRVREGHARPHQDPPDPHPRRPDLPLRQPRPRVPSPRRLPRPSRSSAASSLSR